MLLLFSVLASANPHLDAQNLMVHYQWESLPAVKVCPDSDLTMDEVMMAVHYWSGVTEQRVTRSVRRVEHCSFKELGIIYVSSQFVAAHANEIAVTSINWYEYTDEPHTRYIDTAHVKVPVDLSYRRAKVILHEFGHAFGFGHSEHAIMQAIME